MFEKPETFDGLDLDALRALSVEALDEAKTILALNDSDLTDEQIAKAEELMKASADIDAVIVEREAAAEERAAKIATLRAQSTPDTEPTDVPDEGDDSDGDEPTEDDDDDDKSADAEARKEVVVASAPAPKPAPRKTVAVAEKRAPEVEVPKPAGAVLVAASDVPGFSAGEDLGTLDKVSEAFINRARSFAGGRGSEGGLPAGVYGISKDSQRFGVARIRKPQNEFTTGMDQPLDKQMETVMAAAAESRLPGGNLVAAGGWCAPSETLYDFCSLETTEGMLSIPEVQANRGGINFTKGPDLASIMADANFGFVQTETQAEAGTPKPCYAVVCPPFTEVRLEAVGFCITAGVLTNAAYPELITRVLELATVGHARKVNAATINAISTAIGAAVDHAEIGATTSDVLDALALQASRLRYMYSMSPNATIEAVLPIWAKEIFRSDLSRRTGLDLLAVGDAQINAYLGARGVSAQYVYDYQNLVTGNTGAWTSWPDTLEVMLYPAGAFVRLTTDVIDLGTIYDHAGLTTNTYTAAFFEEGLAVANTCGSGVKVSIDVACLAGRSGAADVTCVGP